mmetsp:Transcript_22088/g.46658  ORF Transcript_22088/g.46658 Transcript_22088/m.46658 type:complete len:369 (-) Transcript_22088:103-1209(-)
MDGDAGDRPSSPPSVSAKRSLRAAINGTPERPDAERVRGNKDRPYPPDNDSASSLNHADVESSRLPVRNLTFELSTLDAPKPGERANGPDSIERGFASEESSIECASSSDWAPGAVCSPRFNDGTARLINEATAAKGSGSEVGICGAASAVIQEAVCQVRHEPSEDARGVVCVPVGGLSPAELSARGGNLSLPTSSADGAVAEGAYLEFEHNAENLGVHARDADVAADEHGRHVTSAAKAIGAPPACACNSDASTGGVLGADGEGPAEVVCEHAVRAVRQGRRVALAQGQCTSGACAGKDWSAGEAVAVPEVARGRTRRCSCVDARASRACDCSMRLILKNKTWNQTYEHAMRTIDGRRRKEICLDAP